MFWSWVFLLIVSASYYRSGVPKKGQARVLYGLDREFPAVAVVNLGPNPSNEAASFQRDNVLEERDTARENLRCGIAGRFFFPFIPFTNAYRVRLNDSFLFSRCESPSRCRSRSDLSWSLFGRGMRRWKRRANPLEVPGFEKPGKTQSRDWACFTRQWRKRVRSWLTGKRQWIVLAN